MSEHRVRTPVFPTYSDVRHLIQIWDGVARARVLGMIQDIGEQTGTPQNPVDWSDPDAWIGERLRGSSAELARRVWTESGREVNPRHTYGSYLFINTYELLRPDGAGVYRVTTRGSAFVRDDAEVIRELDHAEGMDELLSILSTKSRAMRGDLLPEWGEFLHEHSRFGTPSTIKDTLRRRLVNLVERSFVDRDGNYYVITPKGLEYATSFIRRGGEDPKRAVIRAINAYNESQRDALRGRLSIMAPPQFERLVRDLPEAMGYEDVQVTRQSGDKGVDVVATVQFGITTITEVVQVKRHQGSIGRPVLDQLRGALPYHRAIRGTIITIGTFSKGCTEAALFPGAAPITLIDGERLLDLLESHEVGIQRKPATLFELDEAYLQERDAADAGLNGTTPPTL
jgi:restriction system protein